MVINRFTLISGLVLWLWLVAIASGAGGAVAAYYVADGIGGAGQTILAIISAIAAATPFLAVIAVIALLGEIAQGVTWMTAFLHDHESNEEET